MLRSPFDYKSSRQGTTAIRTRAAHLARVNDPALRLPPRPPRPPRRERRRPERPR